MNGAIALLCVIWGLNWVVMKQSTLVVPPVLFTTARFLVGSVVLLAVVFIKKIPLPAHKDVKWIALSGLLQISWFNLSVQVGMQYLSAGFSAILSYSMPLWVAIMAHLWLGEHLTARKLLGLFLGFAGLITLLNMGRGGEWWAIMLTLSGAVAWALSNVLVKAKLSHCDNLQYTTWQMVFGTAVLLAYSLLFDQGRPQWGLQAVLYILYAGVLASSTAFFLWMYILSNTEASKASVSLLLVPVVGVLAGVIFLHEAFYLTTLAGMLLILCGIWFVNSRPTDKPANEAPDTQ